MPVPSAMLLGAETAARPILLVKLLSLSFWKSVRGIVHRR